ncbi:MAG TPA: DUF924 family protein [Geminicoccus sp.]|uniref:DUF924 family protein n=1 Tax=Geminicoccus sp. TaxID=2024832 RepID=UPI002CCA33A0|nr:DUF924 family protein [Geminicoccus sp.]HWL67412.1 DUF924 family protein [Geminicoccus sp.]
MGRHHVDDILSFWFDLPDKAAWFQVDPAFDARIRDRFAGLLLPAAAGAHDDWAATPEGAQALLIVLDQFPRNVHRGTPLAFASDAKAREIARDVLEAGLDRQVPRERRLFLYLPFEHSERLADQDLSCRLMATLEDPGLLDYAEQHRRIIARFGRFPHRNKILGRPSTPEEEAFLLEPNSSF